MRNKLQLYIYKSLRGFKSLRNINPSENVQRFIRDLRPALDTLNYDATEKYVFYMLSYIEGGTFVTILRTIPDRRLDHLSTTVFVPRGLRISAAELDGIVRTTTRKVSNSGVTAEDLAELHDIFAREYEVDETAPETVASEGREYAWCLYGGDRALQLADLLGERLYQPAYLPYAGVLLVDADLGVTGTGTDLSDVQPATVVPLLPPAKDDGGFTPHIYHRVFDKPFAVPLGGTVTITWRRQGFEDIAQEYTVVRPDSTPDTVSTGESRKTISPASFFITAQDSKQPLTDCTVKVNDIEIDGPHAFSHAELVNASVSISCNGYFTYNTRLDLASTTQALIQLQERRKIYRFEMPVRSSDLGAPIKFEIRSKRGIVGSPIEGYSLLDELREGTTRTNMLAYTGSTGQSGRMRLIVSVVVALLAGFALGWLLCPQEKQHAADDEVVAAQADEHVDSAAAAANHAVQLVRDTAAAVPQADAAETQHVDSAATDDANQAQPAVGAVAASNDDIAAAVKYLDDTQRWTAEGMAAYKSLAGLFDDMNNYRLDRIIDFWGEKLSGSKVFARVVRAASNCKSKKVNPRRNGRDTYNRAGDTTINRQGYMNWLDPSRN